MIRGFSGRRPVRMCGPSSFPAETRPKGKQLLHACHAMFCRHETTSVQSFRDTLGSALLPSHVLSGNERCGLHELLSPQQRVPTEFECHLGRSLAWRLKAGYCHWHNGRSCDRLACRKVMTSLEAEGEGAYETWRICRGAAGDKRQLERCGAVMEQCARNCSPRTMTLRKRHRG